MMDHIKICLQVTVGDVANEKSRSEIKLPSRLLLDDTLVAFIAFNLEWEMEERKHFACVA